MTASGSVQAILIPPSHNSVIYSLAAGGTVSIATLFIAGVLPGLLLGVSLMAMCLGFARKRGYPKGEKIPFKQALKITLDALWGLMTVVIILGGILSGIFTATESAAVACLWAFFVTMFIYRDYKWNELPKLMCRTVKTVTIVMILIGFAAAFGAVMTYMQLPSRITEFFTSLSDNKYVILMYLNIMLLLIGHVNGHGADHPDPDASAVAGDQFAGHRSGAFWDDHDGEPGDRADYAAGWFGAVCGERGK